MKIPIATHTINEMGDQSVENWLGTGQDLSLTQFQDTCKEHSRSPKSVLCSYLQSMSLFMTLISIMPHYLLDLS